MFLGLTTALLPSNRRETFFPIRKPEMDPGWLRKGMGVKQSQSNNHGTRLAYGRLCRQPMWPYPEKVVGPARLCRGCQAWLKGNPCLKKKWSSNSTWWKIDSSGTIQIVKGLMGTNSLYGLLSASQGQSRPYFLRSPEKGLGHIFRERAPRRGV